MAVSPSPGSSEESAGEMTHPDPTPGSASPTSTVHNPASDRSSHDSERSLLDSPVDDEENMPELSERAVNRAVSDKGLKAVVGDGEEREMGDGVIMEDKSVKARVVSHPAGVI
jgi:hypothetical protein